MYSDRRTILALVANGRITPADAERLIAAFSQDLEAWWLLAGCALWAGLAQLQPHVASAAVHVFKTVIHTSIPALHHVLMQAAQQLGVNL
jgi:hypothetical protein